jgi:hypothetical protein
MSNLLRIWMNEVEPLHVPSMRLFGDTDATVLLARGGFSGGSLL